LEQSKSNVSVNIRGLVEWHLVRRTRVAGSRKDHYEAATDFWRVMQEIMERRFRWNLRQVLAAAAETARALGEERGPRRTEGAFIDRRLEAVRAFFAAVGAGIGAFAQGHSFAHGGVQHVVRPGAPRAGDRR